MSYWSDQFTEITSVSSVKCSKNTSEGERKESSVTAFLKTPSSISVKITILWVQSSEAHNSGLIFCSIVL